MRYATYSPKRPSIFYTLLQRHQSWIYLFLAFFLIAQPFMLYLVGGDRYDTSLVDPHRTLFFAGPFALNVLKLSQIFGLSLLGLFMVLIVSSQLFGFLHDRDLSGMWLSYPVSRGSHFAQRYLLGVLVLVFVWLTNMAILALRMGTGGSDIFAIYMQYLPIALNYLLALLASYALLVAMQSLAGRASDALYMSLIFQIALPSLCVFILSYMDSSLPNFYGLGYLRQADQWLSQALFLLSPMRGLFQPQSGLHTVWQLLAVFLFWTGLAALGFERRRAERAEQRLAELGRGRLFIILSGLFSGLGLGLAFERIFNQGEPFLPAYLVFFTVGAYLGILISKLVFGSAGRPAFRRSFLLAGLCLLGMLGANLLIELDPMGLSRPEQLAKAEEMLLLRRANLWIRDPYEGLLLRRSQDAKVMEGIQDLAEASYQEGARRKGMLRTGMDETRQPHYFRKSINVQSRYKHGKVRYDHLVYQVKSDEETEHPLDVAFKHDPSLKILSKGLTGLEASELETLEIWTQLRPERLWPQGMRMKDLEDHPAFQLQIHESDSEENTHVVLAFKPQAFEGLIEALEKDAGRDMDERHPVDAKRVAALREQFGQIVPRFKTPLAAQQKNQGQGSFVQIALSLDRRVPAEKLPLDKLQGLEPKPSYFYNEMLSLHPEHYPHTLAYLWDLLALDSEGSTR